MQIIDKQISIETLKKIAKESFGDLVKAVVDVDKKIIAIDAELHADLEAFLLEKGSRQEFLWGINFYPDLPGDDFLEFDSMINMRPSFGNVSRGVDDEKIRQQITEIANEAILK